jgi:hypothetical protein
MVDAVVLHEEVDALDCTLVWRCMVDAVVLHEEADALDCTLVWRCMVDAVDCSNSAGLVWRCIFFLG